MNNPRLWLTHNALLGTFSILIIASACSDRRMTESSFSSWEFELQHYKDFYLPEGWEISLWAESPQFYNPTNMDVDTRGRIWVTEAVNYRDFNNNPKLHFEDGDRVVILEDSDGDGKCDQSKVFVQDKDLQAPLGIAVIGNKVIVSCAPHLLVYTDENGDDIPDHKEILLTGFGGFDHDHSLHALIGGPDGKWYFNTGNAGPHLVQDKSGWNLRSGSVYKGGTPYNTANEAGMISDDGRIWVGGLALRMNSDGTGLQVLAHNFRNAYELTVDSFGNMWQNDNDDEVESCRTTWVMEGGNAGFFSADGSRTWKADQRPNQEIFRAHWHQDDPGVMPAGDRTGAGSPTGVVRYEGDAFGSQFRGMLLSADAGRNVIFGYQPKMEGAGFQLDRSDLIASLSESTEGYVWNDLDQDPRKWFRPSDVSVGTDGSLFISDWYDPIVGGHQMHDTIGYGRIYRITPKGQQLTNPEIDLNTHEGQLLALKSPAINVRIQGFEKLKKGGPEVVSQVRALLQSSNPFHAARAIWLLAHLGEQGNEEVRKQLKQTPNPSLRVAAYRALQSTTGWEHAMALDAAADPSAAVRREVALSLREIPFDDCSRIFSKLVDQFDPNDPYYLEALGIGMQGKESEAFTLLITKESHDPLKWPAKLKRLVWRLHPPESVPALHTLAASQEIPQADRTQFLTALSFVNEKEAVQAMFDLSSNDNTIGHLAQWWLDFRRSNDWLSLWDWPEQKLDPQHLPENLIALQETLLNPSSNIEDRINAATSLTEESVGARLLISLIAEDRLPMAIKKAIANPLLNHTNLEISNMAREFYKRPENSNYLIDDILSLEGNPENGKTLFNTKCLSCHRIAEEGVSIGPNLTRIATKFDKAGVLDAVINPDASVAFGYQQTLIKTTEGQIYNGFEIARNKESIILRDITGNQQVIPLQQIASEQTLQNSIMPDPQYLGLDEQALADLADYLLTLK